MPSPPTLPLPNKAALQHSHAVQKAIQSAIKAADGWISFAHYMELALYAPGLGYYSSGTTKFGSAGDFITAPEISSLFGCTLAQQAAQVIKTQDNANILEFGAGSGKLALDLVLELEKLACLPEKYFILEVSAELRHRQQALFASKAPHLASLFGWLEQLPPHFNGIMLANEVLDAMPVHLVAWHDDKLFEHGVTWKEDKFEWQTRPLHNKALVEIARKLAAQINAAGGPVNNLYLSEISLATRRFMYSIADILQQGIILLIDYGFGSNEYYHPQRSLGTLMCHYRHYSHDDPLYLPGLQDITSHVDFSAVTEAAENSALTLLGYTTQAHFLINCGITEIVSQTPADAMSSYLPLTTQLQKLVSPAEMGELFKVIAFGKNICEPLVGFMNGDKSRLL